MLLNSKVIYKKILQLRQIDKVNDINYVIDDDSLYVYAKGNPLHLKVCDIPESMIPSNLILMINNPPLELTDFKILMFNENIKFNYDKGVLLVDGKKVKAMKFTINRKPPTRWYFFFPKYHDKNITVKCKDGDIYVNEDLVFKSSKISSFTKKLHNEYFTHFFDTKCYIFETKHRIYLKNIYGDYIHLDYK